MESPKISVIAMVDLDGKHVCLVVTDRLTGVTYKAALVASSIILEFFASAGP